MLLRTMLTYDLPARWINLRSSSQKFQCFKLFEQTKMCWLLRDFFSIKVRFPLATFCAFQRYRVTGVKLPRKHQSSSEHWECTCLCRATGSHYQRIWAGRKTEDFHRSRLFQGTVHRLRCEELRNLQMIRCDNAGYCKEMWWSNAYRGVTTFRIYMKSAGKGEASSCSRRNENEKRAIRHCWGACMGQTAIRPHLSRGSGMYGYGHGCH